MAKSENNEVMFGARGKVGNLVVFKNFGNGQTIISKRPRKRRNRFYSEDQEFAKERFKEGVLYAKSAIKDPILAAFYQSFAKPGVSAYNMALADFCQPPKITSVKLNAYRGHVGDVITIRAVDSFKVTSVKVTLSKPDGTVMETGQAVAAANGADWVYTATQANHEPAGTRIQVKASDTPGNVCEHTETASP